MKAVRFVLFFPTSAPWGEKIRRHFGQAFLAPQLCSTINQLCYEGLSNLFRFHATGDDAGGDISLSTHGVDCNDASTDIQ